MQRRCSPRPSACWEGDARRSLPSSPCPALMDAGLWISASGWQHEAPEEAVRQTVGQHLTATRSWHGWPCPITLGLAGHAVRAAGHDSEVLAPEAGQNGRTPRPAHPTCDVQARPLAEVWSLVRYLCLGRRPRRWRMGMPGRGGIGTIRPSPSGAITRQVAWCCPETPISLAGILRPPCAPMPDGLNRRGVPAVATTAPSWLRASASRYADSA
jgi:hypothetical protein